ncbi:hypothetical protein Hanom_Chr05g00467271 [Helianthus anomalus]
MGNCVRKDSGNQRESPVSSPEKPKLSRKSRKRSVAADEDLGDRFCSSDVKKPTTEVKIKITKKQLEELLGMKEMHGLTLEQVLARLMNGGDRVFESNQRSWRPALPSIPE